MKNKAIIILSIILLFLMITAVSASETNTTDTVSTTDNLDASNRCIDEVCNLNDTTDTFSAGDNVEICTSDIYEVCVEKVRDEHQSIDDDLDDNPAFSVKLKNRNNYMKNVVGGNEILGATINEDILGATVNTLSLSITPDKISYTMKITLQANEWRNYVYVSVNEGTKEEIYYHSLDGMTTTTINGDINGDYSHGVTYIVKFYVGSTPNGASQIASRSISLPEVDTQVKLNSNPSVKYNSGTFSVSGTETGMIIC